MTCYRCHSPMEEGFIKDESHGAHLVPEWVEGPPEGSFWCGLKLEGKIRLKVTTYRCEKCGLLESYALGRAGVPLP